MSIARAFTTKRAKREFSDAPQRTMTTKQSLSAGSIRNKISSPVELLSTTNMLSYNAPDLHQASSPSTAYNSASDTSDSDHKSISSVSTPPSSPDTDKAVPEQNHLSSYFNVQPATGLSAAKSTPNLKEAPKIPSRAPSHTKRSHESLSHKKSMSKASLSHKSSAPAMVLEDKTSSSAIRSSLQMFSSIQQRAAANSKLQSSPQPPPTPGPQIYSKQSSMSVDSLFHNETPVKSRPTQGLPTNPNQRTSPMQSRSQSNIKSQPSPSPQQTSSQNTVELQAFISPSYPFGNELAQVTELAEEFSGGKLEFTDEESVFMAEKGLLKFSADDYMSEIHGLFIRTFGEMAREITREASRPRALASDMWI